MAHIEVNADPDVSHKIKPIGKQAHQSRFPIGAIARQRRHAGPGKRGVDMDFAAA